jgi:uncharacterized membrane protein/uncharacterized BrkB/YihY/UPF0761 family membrane protein
MDAMPPDADRPRAGPRRAGQLVGRGRDLQAQAGRRLLDAREEHVTIKLLTDAFREDRDTGGALLAGALAFRLFLWLLPACLVVVALLGFSNADEVGRGLTGAGLGGFTASTIAQATAQAHQGRWFLLLVGVVALYSTSVGLAKAMWIGTSLAWHLPVSRLRRPPRAAGAVVALLLPAVALTLAANWLRSVTYTIGLVITLVMLVLYILFGWFILSLLPRPTNASVTDLLPGALLIGVGIQVLHLVSAFYLVNRISSSSQLYGALGAAATLLLWGYLLARILVGASTLNHTLFRYRDVARLPDRLSGDEAHGSFSVRGLPARLRADWRGLVADLRQGRGPTTGGPAPGAGSGSGPRSGDGDTEPIATLTVWRFDDEDGAEAASRTLGELERQGALRLIDAAVVTWPVGTRRPRASQVLTGAATGALGGSFWGLLFGIIFFAPLLGLAVGAAAGALGGSLRTAGINGAVVQQVRDEVTPGTSALFVMTSDVDVDRVRDAFLSHRPTLIHTSLTPEQDAALREYFRT